jgi:hypothetical protein
MLKALELPRKRVIWEQKREYAPATKSKTILAAALAASASITITDALGRRDML